MPDRFYGPDSAEDRRVTQVQFLDMVLCPLSSRTVEVPQIQLFAWIWGHSLSPQRQVRTVQPVQFPVAVHRQGCVLVPGAHGPDSAALWMVLRRAAHRRDAELRG